MPLPTDAIAIGDSQALHNLADPTVTTGIPVKQAGSNGVEIIDADLVTAPPNTIMFIPDDGPPLFLTPPQFMEKLTGSAIGDNILLGKVGSVWTAMTVAASRVVGRGAAGDLKAMTSTETVAMMLTELTGPYDMWIGAGGMDPRTTNPARRVTAESATNKRMSSGLAFATATAEYAQFEFGLPKGISPAGTFKARFAFYHPTTTAGGVVWGIQGRAFGDGADLDQAFGTAQVVATTAGTTLRQYISAQTADVTLGGSSPFGNNVGQFQIYRDYAHASDTLAEDAILLGVWLTFPMSAISDA